MKAIAAGLAALLVAVSPLAHAQTSTGRLSQVDMNALTDARIVIVKATLQLTPDQEKYWPPIEQAIRQRAKDRQERLEGVVERTEGRADRSPLENSQNRNPVELMQRRADILAQRAADLKKLADAWQPLFQMLTPDQKQRMAALTIVALRDVSSAMEQRRMQDY
jgi:LTXXQ motif family protein